MPVQVEMPDRIKNLPLWHGLPIPFVAFIGPDGNPDFKVVDEKKRKSCLMNNLCGICGEKLDKVVCFIGGPECVKNQVFLDPGMHKECAIYSAMVCPYLSNANHDYSKADPKHLVEGDTVVKLFESVNPHRPHKLAIYYCRGYDMEKVNGAWHAKANRPFKVDWDIMPKTTEKKQE